MGEKNNLTRILLIKWLTIKPGEKKKLPGMFRAHSEPMGERHYKFIVIHFLYFYIYMSLCKYKNMLGEPNKGVHSYRLFGVAIVDVIMTLVAAYIISYFLKYSFLYTSIILFTLGIILHRLFCVKTTVDKFLFY